MRVLLVEDNGDIRYLLRVAVGSTHQLTSFASGEAAIGHLSVVPHYDLMLLDMHLGDISGITVLKHLASLARDGRVLPPIIAYSGDATAGDDAVSLGAKSFIHLNGIAPLLQLLV